MNYRSQELVEAVVFVCVEANICTLSNTAILLWYTYKNKERLPYLLEKWSYNVFPGYWLKKAELYGFFGSYSLKNVVMRLFRSYVKNGDMWLFRQHIEKKWTYSRQRVHFSNLCHDYA